MAATTGTLFATGKSGRQYSVQIYIPDAVAGIVGFNPTGTATSTSPAYWRPTEDVVVTDILCLASPTATSFIATSDGATFAGNVLQYGAQLYNLNNRPRLGWAFRAGALVGAVNG